MLSTTCLRFLFTLNCEIFSMSARLRQAEAARLELVENERQLKERNNDMVSLFVLE